MTTTHAPPQVVEDGVAADIATAAYTIFKRYRKWVSMRTLQAVVADFVDTHPEIVEEEPRRIRAVLRRVAERTARGRKAKLSGYHPDDECFYSRGLIEVLLPYAVDPDGIPPPTVADEMEINRKHAGKEGYGGWEAAISDVRRGLRRLSRRERALLVLRYRGGYRVAWLARQLGENASGVGYQLHRSIGLIQRTLGGPPLGVT